MKKRIVKESDNRYIVEEFNGIWLIGYWQRSQVFINGLGVGFYSFTTRGDAEYSITAHPVLDK